MELEQLSPAEDAHVNDASAADREEENVIEQNSHEVDEGNGGSGDGEEEVNEVADDAASDAAAEFTGSDAGVPVEEAEAATSTNPKTDAGASLGAHGSPEPSGGASSGGELIASPAVKPRESARSSPGATTSPQHSSRAGQKLRHGAQTHKNFLSRNGVSPNYRGPVFAVEDVSVPCAGCGTPVDPVRRMPTVGEKQFYHPECLKCFLCGFASTTGVFFTTAENVAVCCKCHFKGYERCVPAELAAYVEDRRLHLAADGTLVGTGAERVQQDLADEIDKDYRKRALLTDASRSTNTSTARERRMTGGAYFGIDGTARLLLEQRQEQSSRAVVLHQQKQKRMSSVSPHDSSHPTKGNAALLPAVEQRGLTGQRARSAQRPPVDVQTLPYLSAGAKQDERSMTRRGMNLVLRQQLYTVNDPNVLC